MKDFSWRCSHFNFYLEKIKYFQTDDDDQDDGSDYEYDNQILDELGPI